MSDNHKISEFIDNISFRKTVGGGLNPDDVYDSICQLTALYNDVLANSYKENEELKKKLDASTETAKTERSHFPYSEINSMRETDRGYISTRSCDANRTDATEPERPYGMERPYSSELPYSGNRIYNSERSYGVENAYASNRSSIDERTRTPQRSYAEENSYLTERSYSPERSDLHDTGADRTPEVDFKSAFKRDFDSDKSASGVLNRDRSEKRNSANTDTVKNDDILKKMVDKKENNQQEITITSDYSMSGKELRRMKRGDLLELLIEQSRESARLKGRISSLDDEVSDLSRKLNDRTIKIEKAGSIAEASFLLNNVIESAEAAAAQYLENLRALSEKEDIVCKRKEAETQELVERMLTDAKNQCDRLMKATEEKCNAMIYSVKQQCEAMRSDTLQYCESLETETKLKCEELEEITRVKCENREKQTEERCRDLDMKTKENRAKCWNDVSKRMDEFYKIQDHFRDMLGNSGWQSKE